MNNLVNNSDFSDLQKNLDDKLVKALKEIGDEFGTRDEALKKWNYKLDAKKNAIPWWEFDQGKGVVQSPKPLKNLK